MTGTSRNVPLGAEDRPGQGTDFRVWAPAVRKVEVLTEGPAQAVRMRRDDTAYFSALVAQAQPGTRYRFRLDRSDGVMHLSMTGLSAIDPLDT